jgi:acyl carrier protein
VIDETFIRTCAIIERVAGPQRTPADVSRDTRLADGFWLDSVELLEVVLACEQEFSIVFSGTGDLDASQMQTIGSLVDMIVKRRQDTPAERP